MAIATSTALLAAAAVGAGTSLYTSSKAASAQKKAAQAGIDAQQSALEQTREDLSPWRAAGGNALSELAGQLGIPGYQAKTTFQKTPGYDFRMKEGLAAVDSRYGAMGKRLSGERLKGLAQYGQNLASDEYGTWMNRLQNLSGAGQASAAQQAQANQQTANQISNLRSDEGAARASGYVGANNAIQGGLNNLASMPWGQPRSSSYSNKPDYYGV